MLKTLVGKLFGREASKPDSEGFFLNVCCNECGEKFHLFIHKDWELVQNFEKSGGVTYSLRKEIFGVGCRNRIYVNMQFDSGKRLISREIENGEFIEE